jgi:hypothetical protein
MQITNLFKKKDQNTNTQVKVETPIRDEKGRFISKKKLESKVKQTKIGKAKKEEALEPLVVTFFGKEVRKIYKDGVWYFSVDDIHQIAYPAKEGETVTTSEDFDKVKKENSKEVGGVLYATAEGIKKITAEIKGFFPGPFTRWLDESAQLPFIPPPKPEENKENA